MNQSYDIVVVGGGVSGLSAALSASLNGAQTLVLERNKKIGTTVRCGEFFPSLNEAGNLFPEAKTLEKFYPILNNDMIANKTKKIRVFSPQNRKYEFPFDGLVLKRGKFEKTLGDEATKAGADIQTGTNAEAVAKTGREMKILRRNGKGETVVKAKLVIGADGFPSMTAQRTHLQNYTKDTDLALCVQLTVHGANLDEEAVEMYLGTEYAPGGYAWVIPKGRGEANVGVGARFFCLKHGKTIVDYFTALTRNHPVVPKYLREARFSPLIGKTLPVGGMIPRPYADGTLLVGDAAGLVVPTNGGGISTALVSGCIAGQVAAHHVNDGTPLSTYENVLKKEIGKPVRRGYLYRRIGDLFMFHDRAFETLLRMIGTGNLAKTVKAEPILPFFH